MAYAMTKPRLEELAPMGEMNTTPLIDVMLVLLIMLIITIPPQSHKLPLDLPNGPPPTTVNPVRNMLTISPDGVARWNGSAVGDGELTRLLTEVATMARPAEVHFAPDATARYERVDQVLTIAKQAQVRTIGFVGNERYMKAF